MKHTIPIIRDKLQVLEQKAAYEVLMDIMSLYSTKFAFPKHDEPARMFSLLVIKELRNSYEKELEELGKQPQRVYQKTLDQEIEDVSKNSTI